MQLRLAAGACVLASGLFIGSAGGAIAAADPESTVAAGQSQVEPATTSAAAASAPAATATHPKYPIRTAIQDVIKKLQAISKPAQKTIVVKSTPEAVLPDADADAPDPDAVTPAVADRILGSGKSRDDAWHGQRHSGDCRHRIGHGLDRFQRRRDHVGRRRGIS